MSDKISYYGIILVYLSLTFCAGGLVRGCIEEELVNSSWKSCVQACAWRNSGVKDVEDNFCQCTNQQWYRKPSPRD